VTLALKKKQKKQGLVLAKKSGFTVPFLPLGHSRPLQTILLSDQCEIPLQNGLFGAQQRAVTPDTESLNSNKKSAKHPLISAEGCHTQLDGQHCPLITYQGAFLKGGETL
jgi:hypothetical protein